MKRVVILGGTGAMGSQVAGLLHAAGHDVIRVGRGTGVDLSTGAGLAAAFAGADVVLDCVNNTSVLTWRRAISFFAGGAGNVVEAARSTGVSHLVDLSILNVTQPRARRLTAYYAGKAAQEETYRAGGVPLTVVATTAWFTLGETFLDQIRLGPLKAAVVPRLDLQPVSPDAAARLLADAVLADPPPEGAPRTLELAGPQRIRSDELARALAAARGRAVRVLGLSLPSRLLPPGVLLPGPDVPRDPVTLQEWLAG